MLEHVFKKRLIFCASAVPSQIRDTCCLSTCRLKQFNTLQPKWTRAGLTHSAEPHTCFDHVSIRLIFQCTQIQLRISSLAFRKAGGARANDDSLVPRCTTRAISFQNVCPCASLKRRDSLSKRCNFNTIMNVGFESPDRSSCCADRAKPRTCNTLSDSSRNVPKTNCTQHSRSYGGCNDASL